MFLSIFVKGYFSDELLLVLVCSTFLKRNCFSFVLFQLAQNGLLNEPIFFKSYKTSSYFLVFINMTDLLVAQDNLRDLTAITAPAINLEDGQVLIRVEKFALTANTGKVLTWKKFEGF